MGSKGNKADYSGTELRQLEDQMLLLIASGLMDTEISFELGVSYSQIHKTGQRLIAKYGARNRAHLVAEAYHRGDLIPRKNGN